jgi:hypothetical protein
MLKNISEGLDQRGSNHAITLATNVLSVEKLNHLLDRSAFFSTSADASGIFSQHREFGERGSIVAQRELRPSLIRRFCDE